MSELLSCNADKGAAYIFSDGLLLSNMELAPLPIGYALFFRKHHGGYKLAAIIDFE